MQPVILRANAKVNLGLEVTGLRPDGFHGIRTVMMKTRLSDEVVLSLQSSNGPGTVDVTVSGFWAPEGESNIAYKAAAAYLDRAGYDCSDLPFDLVIHIQKAIPAGSGLGGGSSDAAATICGLDTLLRGKDTGHTSPAPYPLSRKDMDQVAQMAGSDVSFFLGGPVCLAEGRGEQLTPVQSRCHFHILLAKPAANLSTELVYQMYDVIGPGDRPDIPAVVHALSSGETGSLQRVVKNELEKAATRLVPDIAAVIALLGRLEPVCSGMTGSGACAYAMFEDESLAQQARLEVSRSRWVSWSHLTESFSEEVHDHGA